MGYLLSIVLGYLVGSSNMAYWISLIKKVDIRANGTLNVYGGTIKKGVAPTAPGVCLYQSNSVMNLYNDALVYDIYIADSGAILNVDSSFTGEAYVKKTGTVSAGTKIATLIGEGTSFTGELYCYNGNGFKVTLSGTDVKAKVVEYHGGDVCLNEELGIYLKEQKKNNTT